MGKSATFTGQSCNRIRSCRLAAVLLALLAGGCATQTFFTPEKEAFAFISRGITQTSGNVRVTAAVPSRDETRRIFQADLYELGIQPIWLNAVNANDDIRIRVVLRSIDAEYFSAYEVAWLLRNEFAGSEHARIERWLLENKLFRRIPAGESRSGFVFTHVAAGTKGFNVDFFSSERFYNFTFFVPMPGFQPDYMNVDFGNLYASDEIAQVPADGARPAIANLPCCSTSESQTETGDPVNVVIVGTGAALRRTLLRASWHETAADSQDGALAGTHRLFGRPPDGTFHLRRTRGDERKELRLWLAPMRIDGQPVWVGQVSQELSDLRALLPFAERRIDPDVDAVRWFVAQDFWYSQSLAKVGLTTGVPASTIESPASNFHGHAYFTDGLRIVLYVSETPVALDDTTILDWEKPGAFSR